MKQKKLIIETCQKKQIELKTNTNKRTIIHIVTIFVESKKEKDLRTLSRD